MPIEKRAGKMCCIINNPMMHCPIFYQTALNAGQSSQEKAVRLSVKHVDCDKTEERSVQIFIPYERPFSLFSEKRNSSWGQPLLPEIFSQPGPHWSEIVAFKPIFAHRT